jgi:hypothetical protein
MATNLHTVLTTFLKLPLLATLDNIYSLLTVAFDTIDHYILLTHLKNCFGFSGTFYTWSEYCLTGKNQFVRIGSHSSPLISSKTGVPQGSVLSPLLFAIYSFPNFHISAFCSVTQRQYADNTHLYVASSLTNFTTDLENLETCLTGLRSWFCHEGLAAFDFNLEKSDSVLFGTRRINHRYSDVTSVQVASTIVPLVDHLKLLGATLDKHLTLNQHAGEVFRGSFYITFGRCVKCAGH